MLRPHHAPWWAALFLLAGLWTAAWPFTIDDAYIVARYAHRLAQGKGYTYNDGVVSDGVTGPLWLAPLTFGAFVGGDPAALGKWLGVLASGAAVSVSLLHVQRRALGGRAAWLVVATMVSSLPFIIWAVAGLESGVAGLLVVLLAGAVGERSPPRWLLAGCSIGALAWLRPELLVVAGVLWGRMCMRHRAAALRAALVALAAGLGVIVFRTTLFGHVLPMSVSAKPAVLGHGFTYLVAALLSPRGLLTATCLVVAARRGGREARLFVAALAAHALAVVLAGGDWMPGRRLFAPLVPLLALTLGSGLVRASLRRPRSACVLVSLWLLASLYEVGPELARARAAGLSQRERGVQLAALVCRADGPVAAIDIGALGSACRDHTFIDLGGLTEREVAYAPGGHLDKRISEAWLARRAPGLILLHSRERPRVDAARRVRWFAGYPVERRVLGFGFVQRSYQVSDVFEHADDYFYLLLVPRP